MTRATTRVWSKPYKRQSGKTMAGGPSASNHKSNRVGFSGNTGLGNPAGKKRFQQRSCHQQFRRASDFSRLSFGSHFGETPHLLNFAPVLFAGACQGGPEPLLAQNHGQKTFTGGLQTSTRLTWAMMIPYFIVLFMLALLRIAPVRAVVQLLLFYYRRKYSVRRRPPVEKLAQGYHNSFPSSTERYVN